MQMHLPLALHFDLFCHHGHGHGHDHDHDQQVAMVAVHDWYLLLASRLMIQPQGAAGS